MPNARLPQETVIGCYKLEKEGVNHYCAPILAFSGLSCFQSQAQAPLDQH
jgi:hypothetical protein